MTNKLIPKNQTKMLLHVDEKITRVFKELYLHMNYISLSGVAIKILSYFWGEIKYEYSEQSNNGQLYASHAGMVKRGYTLSNKSVIKGLKELEHYGFIQKTRQGTQGRGSASLFALTMFPLNGQEATHSWETKKAKYQ